MEKSNQIGAIIFGAAAAFALYKFYSMPKEERNEFISNIKKQTQDLLEDADTTVEKVQHYVAEIKQKSPEQWYDKIYLLRKMIMEFYGNKNTTRQVGFAPASQMS